MSDLISRQAAIEASAGVVQGGGLVEGAINRLIGYVVGLATMYAIVRMTGRRR